MTPRAADVVLRLGCAALGLVWLVAAASKAVAPEAAYELAARAVGGGGPAKALVVATTAAEALLGALMLLGTIRGAVPTLVLLAAATGLLLHVRAAFGGAVRCGCLGLVADSSVDEALRRNAVLAVTAAALAALAAFSRRRALRGAAAESGPARSAP